MDSTVKTVNQQQTEGQTERLILNTPSDKDLSIKQTETSRSTTVIATKQFTCIFL